MVNREKSIGVYALVNTRNKKKYVGSTNDLARREAEHFHYLRNNKHYNQHLQRAFNKDKFIFKILYLCDTREEAANIELQYIKEKNLTKKGYNKAKYAWTPATAKISDSTKGRKFTEEHRENLRGPRPKMSGRKHRLVKPFTVYTKEGIAILEWLDGIQKYAETFKIGDTCVSNNLNNKSNFCKNYIFKFN